MLIVGLTGGIGSGKSTAVDAFCVLGIPIIDADKIAKDMVEVGSKALDELAEHFGDKVLTDLGALDRQQLKNIIFEDETALQKVEDILHPRIKQEIQKQIVEATETSEAAYVIVDIPLLVEKNYQEMFDKVIVVDILPEQQIKRVSKRDNLSNEQIKNIIKAQASREERIKHATHILDNSESPDFLQEQIKSLHKNFLGLSKPQL
ncbi:dephospho-CoA kinase [uncultured Cocleimonas sp.]|uniref:dephospho-CoA kinase n=1 Tax=uncultured Cocleimonas sp. TaxID=1051587 RepID=UPI00260C6721|nr:dephospho-CoA kinase [uncultured Cocleimonas sp.]